MKEKQYDWVGISEVFKKDLPNNRSYTELEAAFSLQLDYRRSRKVTVSGYSALWSWSRRKIKSFLERLGIEIVYPENTSKKQNQAGQIVIQITDRKRTESGQIKFMDFKGLKTKKNRKRTESGQITDRSCTTTIKTLENREIEIEKEERKKEEIPPTPLDWIDSKVWQDFLEHRKLFKPEFTPRAQELMIMKLERFKDEGYNPNDILNNSIEGGWKGVFRPKETQHARAGATTGKQSFTGKAQISGPGQFSDGNPWPVDDIITPDD